jgi:hypothetical protein
MYIVAYVKMAYSCQRQQWNFKQRIRIVTSLRRFHSNTYQYIYGNSPNYSDIVSFFCFYHSHYVLYIALLMICIQYGLCENITVLWDFRFSRQWVWRWKLSVVLLKYKDISEVRTASIIALILEAVTTSETSVYCNKTTWRYVPED